MNPEPTGSEAAGMTIGIVLVAFFAACTTGVEVAMITSTLKPDQFIRNMGKLFQLSGNPAIGDHDILFIHPS
jgi:hypothetical protein